MGLAEEHFGKILHEELSAYRDELFISTKAGYEMWPGPYGNWGSRKYLMASLDQSLKRMDLDYVDLFYHHRPDPETPMEETADALTDIVRSGKALYIGISNYREPEAAKMIALLKKNGTPCLIEQPRYNLLERWEEEGLFDTLYENGVGCISYSPLAQGALTGKYLNGIPKDSRAARKFTSVGERYINPETIAKVSKLFEIAGERGESLPQMALAWNLRRKEVCSVLIGASSPEQLTENVKALQAKPFTGAELAAIDRITGAEPDAGRTERKPDKEGTT